MILLSILGCDAFHLSVEEDTADAPTEVSELIPNPIADSDWTSDRLRITIENGAAYVFDFGIAETNTECSIDTEYGCWTAEDCGDGYTSPQGTYAHGKVCHPLNREGEGRGSDNFVVELNYSANLYSVIAGLNDIEVEQGVTTGFPAPTVEQSYEFKVTYYLRATKIDDPSAEVECWVWGVDPDHFAEENCKVPLPMSHYTTSHVLLDLAQ